jgi:hypothetical protein
VDVLNDPRIAALVAMGLAAIFWWLGYRSGYTDGYKAARRHSASGWPYEVSSWKDDVKFAVTGGGATLARFRRLEDAMDFKSMKTTDPRDEYTTYYVSETSPDGL